jgi:outer membrane protein assembly factor BamE (lipoprotein component of BamABCDE complex)
MAILKKHLTFIVSDTTIVIIANLYFLDGGILMKRITMAASLAATVLLTGCNTMAYKTATAPISQARADRVVDGQTTRLDIISMFGNPNGSSAMNMASSMMANVRVVNAPNTPNHSELMSYRDCTSSAIGSSQLLSFQAKGQGREVCKVFTALLDQNDVVIAHKYTDDNFITQDKLASITPNRSTKKDVIRTLAGPTSVTPVGDKTLYLYKTCVTKTKVGGFMTFNMNRDQDCQQATIVIDKKTNVVSKVNFIPFAGVYDDNPTPYMMKH